MPKDQNLEVLLTLREDLRELVTEGRQLLKDYQAERKLLDEKMAWFKTVVAEALLAPEKEIAEKVSAGLDNLGEHLQTAIKAAEQGVNDRFDVLSRILLGEDDQSRREGKPTLMELAVRAKSRERLVGDSLREHLKRDGHKR